VVQDALTFYLGLRALVQARAQGAVDAQEADGLAVQESLGNGQGEKA
jgi:hypothetical protein